MKEALRVSQAQPHACGSMTSDAKSSTTAVCAAVHAMWGTTTAARETITVQTIGTTSVVLMQVAIDNDHVLLSGS